MSNSRFRAACRRKRQALRAEMANQFGKQHVSLDALRAWVLHGGSIETYKKAYSVRVQRTTAAGLFKTLLD